MATDRTTGGAGEPEETAFVSETLDRIVARACDANWAKGRDALRSELRAIIKDELINAALTGMVEDIREEHEAERVLKAALAWFDTEHALAASDEIPAWVPEGRAALAKSGAA